MDGKVWNWFGWDVFRKIRFVTSIQNLFGISSWVETGLMQLILLRGRPTPSRPSCADAILELGAA